MIDHVDIAVTDFSRAKSFYESALKPLGFGLIAEKAGAFAGFGAAGKLFFSIDVGARPKGGTHIAFAARTRAEVDAFHRAAVAAGGRDNGSPGLRPQYHKDYYGAFVFDPDGNNIEAVCHA
jgi:catechol 2,3-dioxygenase-like lactoylglutathione lyase family enzyme